MPGSVAEIRTGYSRIRDQKFADIQTGVLCCDQDVISLDPSWQTDHLDIFRAFLQSPHAVLKYSHDDTYVTEHFQLV